MAYSSGMLNKRVTILNKQSGTTFGDTTTYGPVAHVWSDVTWSKGVKALHEGALDAFDTVMFRMRWNPFVSRDSQLQYDDVTYQIMSFHADKMANTIQITAQELVK